jgi:hypothetical protein
MQRNGSVARGRRGAATAGGSKHQDECDACGPSRPDAPAPIGYHRSDINREARDVRRI